MLSDKTLRLVVRDDVASKEFLELALRSPPCRDFIERNVGGASGSMKNITQASIREIPVPLPPLTEQQRIAEILRETLEMVAKARIAAEEQLAAINAMPASLLRKAFQGQL
jgi:type I restriction enzyme S subunit